MTGLIYATIEEAAPLLERGKSEQISKTPYQCYRLTPGSESKEMIMIISGIGKVAATMATQYLILKYQASQIINSGICGAVSDAAVLNQVYRITQTREGDLDPRFAGVFTCNNFKNPVTPLITARLTTHDVPIYDQQRREHIAQWGMLVDMEGAAVARVCHIHGVPCIMLKCVSDFADADGQRTLKENLQTASAKLADILCDELENIS